MPGPSPAVAAHCTRALLRLAIAALLATTASAIAASAAAQEPDRETGEHEEDSPLLRWRYFHDPRAFPGTTIPAGALERARNQMRDRWPGLFTRRNGNVAADFTLSASSWTQLGPAPISNGSAGRVSAIAVDPADPATVYVGAAQGGVWKTTDGALTWTPLTDGECSLAMGSIAIDPVDPGIIYAGTGELHFSSDSYYGCGMLRSIDGGLTWTRHGAAEFQTATGGARVSRLVIDPTTAGSTSSTTVYAATSVGLWISHDSGQSWARTLAGVIDDLATDAASPGTLYAARGLLVADIDNGIYKSADSGTTWNRLTSFPTTNAGRIALAASPGTPGVVYAAVQNSFDGIDDGKLLGIWRTEDGGTSWEKRSASRADCSTQCWYDLVLAVDPRDPNTLYFGGVSFYRSRDGAQTFENVLHSAHVDQHAITFDPSDPGTLYIGNDGGIYRSRDETASWQSLNAGLAITQFYPGVSLHPNDTTIVLGGTQDNGTLETTDGDPVWSAVLGADGGYTAIDYLDPRFSWAETQWTPLSNFSGPRLRIGAGSFERMANGIQTGDRALFIPPLVMDGTDPTTLYFGTYRVYRTLTRGATWTVISPDLSANASVSTIAPSEADPKTVWAGTTDGNVHVTRDDGMTWNLRISGLPRRWVTDIAADATDPETAILTLSGFGTGHVFRTTNAGLSWTDISGGLPDVPVNCVLTDPALGTSIYVGTDLGVFRSFDNGTTWQPFMDGLPNVAVFDLVYNRHTGVAAAATHGRSLWAARPAIASVLAIEDDSVHFDALGDTRQLTAVAIDLVGDTIGELAPVWRSLDPTVATVDAGGLVTARGNGHSSVIALFAGAADTADIVVRQIAVSIENLPATLDLVEGETRILGARGVDALGTAISDGSITWTSSDIDVATVDPDGIVHGVGTGSASLEAMIDRAHATVTISVGAPSTATIDATAATVTDTPLGVAGTMVPLLRFDITVDGIEPVRITQLVFDVAGRDPGAKLFVVQDANRNGRFDPDETPVAGATLDLHSVEPVQATLRPAAMDIAGNAAAAFVVVIQFSGASPNGARFQATYQPRLTTAVGTRSGAQDRLVLPAQPVASEAVSSTVLRDGEMLTFSENPVRSDRVIFNFRVPPGRAAVYTITGRLVIDLTRHIENDARLEWDLRNGNGNRIAPGVYLVIFDVAGTVVRERLLVLTRRDDGETQDPDSITHSPAGVRSQGTIRSHSSASERATTATTGSVSLRL